MKKSAIMPKRAESSYLMLNSKPDLHCGRSCMHRCSWASNRAYGFDVVHQLCCRWLDTDLNNFSGVDICAAKPPSMYVWWGDSGYRSACIFERRLVVTLTGCELKAEHNSLALTWDDNQACVLTPCSMQAGR